MAQQQIGKYQILQVIASGGQATVYLARDDQLGREVALKVLHPHQAQDRQYVERFFREAQMAAAINHPNVVVIHDVGQAGELYYIAMEYIPSSLDRLLEQGPRPTVNEIVSLVYQIALGLQAAHAQSVIHRDLKPQNILLTEAGIPKVSDFGIARALEQSTLTSTGMIMGTPFYMSPEQARGERVDARSDVYSLGCVLYQMLTGTLPFQGTTPYSVIRQHIEDIHQPVSTLRPDIPQWLSHVVDRAMAKGPDQRFQNMSEMADALRMETPIAAQPSSGRPVASPLPPSSSSTSPVASPNLRPKAPVISQKLLAYGGATLLVAALLIGAVFAPNFLIGQPDSPGSGDTGTTPAPTASPDQLPDRNVPGKTGATVVAPAPTLPKRVAANVGGVGEGNPDSDYQPPTNATQPAPPPTTAVPTQAVPAGAQNAASVCGGNTTACSIQGRIEFPGQVQVYQFGAPTGDTVLVTLAEGPDMELLLLELFDPEARLVGNSHTAGSRTATIDTKLETAGRYTIRVRHDPGLKEGTYTLSLNQSSKKGAIPIAPSSTPSNITVPGEVHWYIFDARAGDTVFVTLAEGPDMDYLRLELFDSEARLVGTDHTAGSRTATIDTKLETAGRYTMRVRHAPGVKTGTYTLSFNQFSP